MGIASLNFWRTADGTRFFRNTENGFALQNVTAQNGEPETIETFEGSLADDYIIDGAYLFRKADGAIYNVLTGERAQVKYSMFRQDFQADRFWISPNGKYCVIRGVNVGNVAACGVMDLENGKMTAYTDDVFGFLAGAVVTDDGAVILSVSSGESGASFYQLRADAKRASAQNTDAQEETSRNADDPGTEAAH